MDPRIWEEVAKLKDTRVYLDPKERAIINAFDFKAVIQFQATYPELYPKHLRVRSSLIGCTFFVRAAAQMRAFNFANTENEYSDVFRPMVSALKAGSTMASGHSETSCWSMNPYMLCGETLCTNPKNPEECSNPVISLIDPFDGYSKKNSHMIACAMAQQLFMCWEKRQPARVKLPINGTKVAVCVQCKARIESGPGAADASLKKCLSCSRCKVSVYCSEACQKLHYPKHKMNCKSFSEYLAAEEADNTS